MEIRDWDIIHKLFLYKNITKAAQALYISQPALTSKIKVIEEELGAALIERNNKGIEFTLIGNYVAQYAQERLSDFRLFKEDVRAMAHEMVGNLRIVAPYIIVKYKLPGIILAFQKMYPLVTFDITTVHSGEVATYLKSHFYHFGFVRNNLKVDAMNVLPIESGGISIAYHKKFALEELPYLRKIEYQTDNYYHNILEEWWNTHFKKPAVAAVKVSDLESCKEMILAGVGYGILPDLVLSQNHHLHVYSILNVDGEPLTRCTWMIYQDSVAQRILPRTFYEFMKKYAVDC